MSSVSVIIPTYNDSNKLPNAIESVLNQTQDISEIIIIDDASNESPHKIVEKYDRENIFFESHKENRGGSAARNTGIELATGDYIAFLDADDEWLPEKTERQLKILQSRSDEWVAVHCGRKFQLRWRSRLGYFLSKVVGTRREPPKEGGEELIKEILLQNLSTGASTLLVESKTVDEIGGFDSDFPRHQDWEFLIRILQQGKLAYVNEPLVVKHGTGRPSATVHEEAKKLLLNRFSEEISALEADGYDIKHTQNIHLTKLYIEEGQLQEGLKRLDLSRMSFSEVLSIMWSISIGIQKGITN